MLTYHPATDAYHTSLRMLTLVSFQPSFAYQRDLLRILDFYMIFPALLLEVRLHRPSVQRRKRLDLAANRYHFTGSPRTVFMRMLPFQNAGLKLLISHKLIDYQEDRVKRSGIQAPPALEGLVATASSAHSSLLTFLVTELATIELHGKDGLKSRTNLMDYRYDST